MDLGRLMKKIRRLTKANAEVATALIAFFLLAQGILGCGGGVAERGSAERPIVFLLSPEHGAKLADEARHALEEMLRHESGLKFEIRTATHALEAIEAFDREADVGLLNLFEYVLAHGEYGVEAVFQVTRKGGSTGYSGVLLSRADGSIAGLADLAGKRIAYTDPFSTSGFVFPAKLLADNGVRPLSEFAGSHERALARLRSGDADAAATFASAVSGDSLLRVIAMTDTIPNEPIFVRDWFKPEMKARIVAAIERVFTSDEGARIVKSIADIEGLTPTSDDAYADLRSAIRTAGASVYEVVPEGVRVESRRRGINLGPAL